MAKVKNFKTIFPAVSVPLNDSAGSRASTARESKDLYATATQARSQA